MLLHLSFRRRERGYQGPEHLERCIWYVRACSILELMQDLKTHVLPGLKCFLVWIYSFLRGMPVHILTSIFYLYQDETRLRAKKLLPKNPSRSCHP